MRYSGIMSKELFAIKRKDGWLVTITHTFMVETKEDVDEEIRIHGLKKHTQVVEDMLKVAKKRDAK